MKDLAGPQGSSPTPLRDGEIIQFKGIGNLGVVPYQRYGTADDGVSKRRDSNPQSITGG